MSTKNSSGSTTGGVGVLGLLGVAFVVLKLTDVIAWSWWWVTAPFWLPIPIILVVIIVIALMAYGGRNNR